MLEVLEVLGGRTTAPGCYLGLMPSCFRSFSRGINKRRIPPPVEILCPNPAKLVRRGE